MSQPPRPSGAPPPRPAGSPPPRPAGSPPPRPAGAPPPRPAGAPPPRPAGAPPPRPAGAPPPRPAGAPPRPAGPPPQVSSSGAPPARPPNMQPLRPAGPPPTISDSSSASKSVGSAPPRPSGPSPSRPTDAPPKELNEGAKTQKSGDIPLPKENVNVASTNSPATSTSNTPASPPKPEKPPVVIRPPPGAPPSSNLISAPAINPPPGMPPSKIAPPPGAPPPKENSVIKPPSGEPPAKPLPGASPIKPPPGGPPIKPPAGAPPVKPSSGMPTIKQVDGGIPGPPTDPPSSVPGPPKGPPPGPPQVAPPPPKDTVVVGASAGSEESTTSGGRTLVRKGRLHLKLLEARGLCRPSVKKDDKKVFKADVYCKLKIGAKSKNVKEAKSKTWKKSGQDVGFQEETLWINLDNPESMLTNDKDILVTVEIWDENMIADDLLGACDVSLLRFMDGGSHKQTIPLSHARTNLPAGSIDIEFRLDIASVGMLSIIVMEGRNLKNMELVGKQDPYCKFEHHTMMKRTKTIEKGGTNPYFGEEELCFWITKDTWIHDMAVRLFDEDVGSDDFIGEGTFSVLTSMQSRGQTDTIIRLMNSGKPAGELLCKIQFYPAGQLSIRCIAGRKLRDVDSVGRQDPYVKFTLDGACIKTSVRTKTDTDGGKEPEWDERFDFDVVDQFTMIIECWDYDTMGDDDLIGEMSLSLLPVFRNGYIDNWHALQFSGKFGAVQRAGELHLELSFVGPPGVAYPQHQVGMDAFDEKERFTKETSHLRVTEAPKPIELTSTQIVQEAKKFVAIDNKSEFSEEEILHAFKFIDLDRNTFIGAAEIRHILICMGELITDGEVDEMVRMVDRDGDGQVSYEEFRKMVVHPDPGSLAFGKEDDVNEINQHAEIVTEEDRLRDIEIKREKKALLDRFIGDNNINLDILRRVFERFKKTNKNGLTFEDFYILFQVEPTGEYRKLHTLYAGEKLADIRELLLGMSNLLEIDKTLKAEFCFEIYDDDHNGFITEDELRNILKATHMTTEANVIKKAQTILKQADTDGDHKMNLDEFHIISKKFPNIIFPHHK